jgi:hypothetical protein
MNHTPDYAALERDRNSRIANASAALFEGEKKRLADIQRQTELAFARLYGGKLTPEITARLLEGQILDADVLCTVSGGLDEMPKFLGFIRVWPRQTRFLSQKMFGLCRCQIEGKFSTGGS